MDADQGPGQGAQQPPAGQADAAALRRGLAAYVAALHEAYLDTVRQQAPQREATLPLVAGEFTAAFVATAGLHLLATRDELPATAAHEQVLRGELGPMRWRVRFLDPSVAPEFATPPPDSNDAAAVRTHVLEVLGIEQALYHLMLGAGSSLSAHHARHAGTGLAGAHLAEAP